jgi:hypothetical protein
MTTPRSFLAFRLSVLLLAGLVAAACQDGAEPIVVEATGVVAGLVWLDRDGSGELEATDAPVRDVTVQLLTRHGNTPMHTATSNASGEFVIEDVPVGDYRVAVDQGTVGDTLQVLRIDSVNITVAADAPTVVLVGLSYPGQTIAEARAAPPETRVFIEGLVLTRWGTFGETSLHVRDSTGAIQAVRAQQTGVIPGDSVRLLGVTGLQAGQPVLRDAQVFLLRTGIESPPPDTVTTAEAASARDGVLDADLVRVDSAVVQDTSRNAAGDFVITVDDGSGPVGVVLDAQVAFSFQLDGPFVGQIVRATGVLVPASAGGPWTVKPRSNLDLTVGPLSYPTVPIATARQEPPDTRLIVIGRALNAWNVFGDATVHVRDATGAIRAVQVPAAAINAGDSIRVVGTTTTQTGQPVLSQVWTRVLQAATTPPLPDTVTTAQAATARAGSLDAGLVRIAEAVIQDTTRNADNEVVLIVDDGSGPARVVFDRDTPFVLAWPQQDGQPQVIGTLIDATGLLVPRPQAADEWVLKPRASADVTLRSGG